MFLCIFVVSPTPANSQPSAISSSLLSDLEGLSLSNISTTMQVCVCSRNTYDISSSVCWESIVFVWPTLTGAQGELKWTSLPRGTFLPKTPSIDLSCLLIFITSQDSATALPVSCISYSLSSSPGCLLLFGTLELYFCVSSGSPASLFLPLISLSSCLSPSIAPCQVLCPSCLCVVYIWWVTFLSVTAPFSPRGVFSVSPPPPGEKLPGRFCSFGCLPCLFCVIAPVIIHNRQSFFFSAFTYFVFAVISFLESI